MKKAILFFIISLSYIYLNAQDKEPSPLKLKVTIGANRVDTNISREMFPQKHIIRTWQWNTDPKWTRALNMNAEQQWFLWGYFDKSHPGKEKLDAIFDPPLTPQSAESFQYEPTLKIINPGDFTVKNNDPQNSIFGFKFNNFLHKINYICFC